MKRFVLKLSLLSFLLLCYVVGSHVIVWIKVSDEADEVYRISDDQKILFLGSSTLGYSVEESESYSNKVIWVSASPLEMALCRATELERRGELNKVAVLAIPFNYQILGQSQKSILEFDWYKELPVAWRYLELLPESKLSFVLYILSNLRPKVPFEACGKIEADMSISLADLSLGKREEFLQMLKKMFCSINPETDNYEMWENHLKRELKAVKQICDKYQIVMVLYRHPIMGWFRQWMPLNYSSCEKQWIEYFKSIGIEFVDLVVELDESGYHDHMHLTPDGRKKFSEAIVNILNGFVGNYEK